MRRGNDVVEDEIGNEDNSTVGRGVPPAKAKPLIDILHEDANAVVEYEFTIKWSGKVRLIISASWPCMGSVRTQIMLGFGYQKTTLRTTQNTLTSR